MSRLRKFAEIIDEYGQDYMNRFGQVTPYHILFKDHGNQIASLSLDGAIQYIMEIIDELNEQYNNEPGFYRIDESEKEELLQAFRNEKNDSGIDILFVVKDFLLVSEGLEKESSFRKTYRKIVSKRREK